METKVYPLPIEPVELLQRLRKAPGVFLLESSLLQGERGRYSFVGYDPFAIIKGQTPGDLNKLEKVYSRFARQGRSGLTPFPAGMVGYLSYDFGLRFEGIKARPQKESLPGFVFGLYDRILTIDHFKKKCVITSTGWPHPPGLKRKNAAHKRLKEAEELIHHLSSTSNVAPNRARKLVSFRSNFNRAEYCKAVKKALNYIKAGDIYQVNLAQSFLCQYTTPVDATALYADLRRLSPSCFGGYFDLGASQIVSSSPEMFLNVRGRKVETRPMKGTKGRGQNRAQDREQVLRLRDNSKEKAELLMVTDLERNDLGRVCDFGSVRVKKLREIEKYRTVFQATSTVSGTLAKDKNGFDLIKAAFPSGSVTGCPKIRAMQIIEEIEPAARGIYTGGLGYMSFSGDMAFNVLIRTMVVQGKKVRFHVGSGIVADSRPAAEYEETLLKAKALKESLIYE